ncbi:flagellar protein [Geomicrobium sp. JCM 19037]|uniref:flagellar protein FlaG n=1 Tax=Geomicrobium sp. JCM 19037 TaxID=1460634 RepID=UPI00045F2606|nr:flagellar protein FlaG [Geomicrobium sp. JCM 19037]GAK02599.1 flagellar protein [Geomicrobium sp. JCM 19037]
METNDITVRPSTIAQASLPRAPKNEGIDPQNKAKTMELAQVKIHVDEANERLQSVHTNLRFKIHEDLSRVYVQVVDRFSDEVVREVPPEKLLDMSAALLRQVGLIVDERS